MFSRKAKDKYHNIQKWKKNPSRMLSNPTLFVKLERYEKQAEMGRESAKEATSTEH